MQECPNCGGLLIGDVDDDLYLNYETSPSGYYCPGCGWSSDEMGEDDEVCPTCGGTGDNHKAACSEDDAIWY